MSAIILPNNHYSLGIANDIEAIIAPLKSYGVEYFLHARCFSDGSLYTLTNNNNLYKHHFKCGYKLGPSISNVPLSKSISFLALSSLDNIYNKAIDDYRQIFQLDHFLFLVEPHANHVDLFIVASKINNDSIINFYINKLDVLNKFKFYFREKAKELIIQSDKNKIFIPQDLKVDYLDPKKIQNMHIEDTERDMQIEPNKYAIIHQNRKIILTRKEVDCIDLLKQGYTIKEIGKLMCNSPRTIEDLISNVKCKLGVENKAVLLKIASDIFNW